MPIKVFIDQGHNPVNPNAGAEGNGYREQDLTYVIGQELATLLAANPNFEVKLSRNSETEQLGTSIATSLAARVNAATEWGADLFLSLHANASESAAPSGSEAFVYRMSSTAYYIAEQLLRGLHESTGLPTRGVFCPSGIICSTKNANACSLSGDGLYFESTGCFLNGKPARSFCGRTLSGSALLLRFLKCTRLCKVCCHIFCTSRR